jgi:hypothetical protein
VFDSLLRRKRSGMREDRHCRGEGPWCRGRLADVVERVTDGTRGWSVKRKVSYQTVVGVRRPDIVASRGREIAVVDVQVVAPNPSLDSAHRKKVAKYRDEAHSPRAWCEELRYNQGGERKKKRKCDLPALPSRGDVSGLPSPRSPCVSGADGPGAGTI